MIVVLNVVDCLLVLGELMLDIKYVTGKDDADMAVVSDIIRVYANVELFSCR